MRLLNNLCVVFFLMLRELIGAVIGLIAIFIVILFNPKSFRESKSTKLKKVSEGMDIKKLAWMGKIKADWRD